MFYNVF